VSLLEFNNNGIYCPIADVYIDPLLPVKNAIITHGHADHARQGNENYASTPSTALIMNHRLGADQNYEQYAYGEQFFINGVGFSFHPAGHIIGSAQVRVEYKGEVWVASGDYKVSSDKISENFEPVKCHHFITESTFGLPVFKWDDSSAVFKDIDEWWTSNAAEGKTSVILTYALGKAQRILAELIPNDLPIFGHGAICKMNEVLAPLNLPMREILHWSEYDKTIHKGALLLTTPGSVGNSFLTKFKPTSMAMASGWMAIRGTRRRKGLDRGFILSDHADWSGLLHAIKYTEAENIYVTHGYQKQFAKFLNEQGYNAKALETLYSTEE
jgi:putative mRNA 3-end processing factor